MYRKEPESCELKLIVGLAVVSLDTASNKRHLGKRQIALGSNSEPSQVG